MTPITYQVNEGLITQISLNKSPSNKDNRMVILRAGSEVTKHFRFHFTRFNL